MKDIFDILNSLSPEKRALLEAKLKNDGSRYNIFPLSFAQQRLWFINQMDTESTAYNIPTAIELEGLLDISALEKSVNEIVRRHEILRTVFRIIDNVPMQIVLPFSPRRLRLTDLSTSACLEKKDAALKLIEKEKDYMFDLLTGPLLICHLYKIADNRYILFILMHHIITDGWSMEIFIREFGILYESFSGRGRTADLPPLSIQYADFSVWQKKWMEGDVKQKQLEYWKGKLSELPPPLKFPGEKKTQPDPGAKCVEKSLFLPEMYSEEIKKLGAAAKTTSYMVYLAILQILLYRHTGQNDICIGTPVANRNRSEIEDLIGFFVNTLVLRTKINDKSAFREYLREVKKMALEAYANQDLPYEKLVEELFPGRDRTNSSFFRTIYLHGSNLHSRLELPDLKITPLEIRSESAKYDLTVSVSEDPGIGVTITFSYMSSLISDGSAGLLLNHFKVLTDDIIKNPEKKICDLSIMTDQELNQIIYEWNNLHNIKSEPETFPVIFERQAAISPHNVAVSAGAEQLTFSVLNSRANMLARFLIKKGVTPEAIVGISMGRSVSMIAAILAVMKAGGTYLPLDPFYPADRFKYILQDAGVKTLITEEPFLKDLPLTSCSVICTDRDREEISGESDANLQMEIPVQNAAYVIYTSGSTGRPKGSVIQYDSMYNLHAALDKYILPEYSHEKLKVSLNTTIMFDASIAQLLMILSGHSLYIVPEEIRRDIPELANFARNNKLDLLDCVTSILKILVDENLLEGEQKPRIIFTGGEAFDDETWSKLGRIKKTEFYNLYGPTECTVVSAISRVSSHRCGASIGRPLPDAPVYILDNNLNVVPVGTPGELFIGGAAVGRGYLNRPDMTAEKFIPDKFSLLQGGRLYRTGDLARYNSDGTIDYLGRLDHQVKIRGLRIELGEIESDIRKFPGVKDAIVVLKEKGDDKFLHAYVVAQNLTAVKIPEIKDFLRKELPEYMIPSAFMLLNAVPLTPSGKIDRSLLPEPPEYDPEEEKVYISPRNAAEEIVAGVMANVLNKKEVGVNENFFDIGGHSLLATQVIYRLRDIFQVPLQIKSIFDYPTVAALAGQVELAKSSSAGISQSPITRVSREEPLPLSFAQERLWFLNQLNPKSTAYNVPEALRISGEINAELLEKSLNIITSRHEILRTSFLSFEGKPFQNITPEYNVTLEVIEASAYSPAEQEILIKESVNREIQKPFLLDILPLFRALLIRLSENQSVLVLTFHHIITDGWSSQVMFTELMKYYNSLLKGLPPAAYDLPVQYADYAAWQRKYFLGENLRRHIDYWTEKLKDSPQLLDLPIDRPRPAVQNYEGSFICFQLSKELSGAVKKINRNYGVTLFMSLLSVYQVLLYRYSRQKDILIGTPIANRNRADIEELIGFFVNTLVIRAHISDRMKFSDLLKQTKETALEAYTYQDLPFEMIIDALHLERSMSYSPLFQVMFSAENMQADNRFSNSSLDVRQIEIPAATSKYDISLSAVEENDGLKLAFEYNTNLFEKETIGRMFRHFERILKAVLANPELRISDIALISPEEEFLTVNEMINEDSDHNRKYGRVYAMLLKEESTGEILRSWNRRNSVEQYGSGKFFHGIFEEQALITPERIAVVSEQESLSFGELNQRANRIAHYLIKNGAGAEDVIGVLIGRKANLVASILAVMKSGAGYLPLDPVYPKGRIEYILKDAGVRLLVSEEALTEDLSLEACKVISLDREEDSILKESDLNPEINILPENIAYVIYTSGSTGKPKGSIVQHGNLHNYFRVIGEKYSPFFKENPVRVVLNTTVMFDASIQQIMFMLYGNTLYIPPEEIRHDGLSLTDYILNNRIDILDCVPSLLKVFTSAGLFHRSDFMPSAVLAGGEALDDSLWKELCGIEKTVFFNTYGPTECTVDAAICRVRDYPQKPTIGKPPLNVETYIMDGDLNLLPIGASGELCIGGLSVGRGYLNKPDLTAEKFIPNPFSLRPGERLYRTGDLAKYNLDGTIEFLGRIDSQVKLRGFRIELGEIEQVLMQHAKLKDAVVMMKERKEGSRYLLAYITLKEAQDEELYKIQTDEIKHFLRSQLPDYMIPSQILILKEMPLAPNGKLDRRALPEPAVEISLDEEMMPETENEKILANVWKEVLGLESVGIHDNFFEIGGDSILAIQVVAKAREKGINIQPVHLFQHQTISLLALLVKDAVENNKDEDNLSDGRMNLTPVQQSFFEQNLSQRNHWNQSVFFEIKEKIELKLVEDVIKAIFNHHDVLHSFFIRENDSWKMEFFPGFEKIPLYVFDLSDVSEEQIKPEIESRVFEIQGSLNIETGPIIRFAFFTLGEGRKDKLFIAAHHLIIDVVSWRILLEDTLTAYSQVKEHKPVLLPPKSTSYRKWSQFLTEYSGSEEIQKEIDFWLRLPYYKWTPVERDYTNAEYLEKDTAEVNCSLDAEDTLLLIREGKKNLNANIFEILLTALTRAYSAWSEKRILLIDLEGHGRETLNEKYDLSRTVGWFTSVYPILLDLKTSVYPLESLKEIKEQIRAVPAHGIGFGILKYLSEDKALREKFYSLPKSEISFNYLGQLNQFAQEENPLFAPVSYNKGPERGLLNSAAYLIDITCFVSSGIFQVQMKYGNNIFRENSMLTFSRAFIDELRLIIVSCKNGQLEFTGSDFPLAHLNNGKFDRILNRLNKKNPKA